ncbi:MAG: discoidin domain-containing protein [Clostridia bacterium]|nr:discoidin domain-containing protein [Clostridia bacterium]
MKKLSLMLAFVLVFALVLVACGDETETSSTPATESSVAATESSEAATEESSEAATEESSEAATEESSEAATEESSEASTEESTEPPVAGTDNLAAGKSYTSTPLFRAGGAEVGWGWDENAPVAYPDEEDKSMTDGVIAAADTVYTDAIWAGWNHNTPAYAETGYSAITVDLGEVKDLAKAVMHLGSSGLGSGIGAGNMVVEVAVSTDGETFETVGAVVPEDDAASCVVETVIEFEAVASAQYVQFRMIRGGWMFVSEVEVYGAE